MANPYTISEINKMNRETFVSAFGTVFENSPWAAEAAFESVPFDSFDSLNEALCLVVQNATEEMKLELLCAHPELGTNKRMAEASVQEQKGAGVQYSADKGADLLRKLNIKYRNKNGFPFIIAVKGLTKEMIIDAMQERLKRDTSTEFACAIAEVMKIGRFRLQEMFQAE